MTQGDGSPAALHEDGLPPDDFARAHVKVQVPVQPGEDASAWRRRAFYAWLDRLNALLLSGDVIASGVTCGPCSASADPRCVIHPAHWHRVRLGWVSVSRIGLRIDDQVTMPTGEDVVALRLRWTKSPIEVTAEVPSPSTTQDPPKVQLLRFLVEHIRDSPGRRSLTKKQIWHHALKVGVKERVTARKLREEALAIVRKETGESLSAWRTGGSVGGERGEPHAQLVAELGKLSPKPSNRNRRP